MTGNGLPSQDLPPGRKARRRMVAVVLWLPRRFLAAGLTLVISLRPNGSPGATTQGASPEPSAASSPASPTSPTPTRHQPRHQPRSHHWFPTHRSRNHDGRAACPPFPEPLLGQDITSITGAGKQIALTFDGGANAAGLQSILSTLEREHVRATFFLTGTRAAANPDGVARIVASGHRLGNHSMTHPAFTQLTDPMIADEIGRAESAIVAAGGSPRPFFRFPFGDRDARTINTVNGLGYVPVRWSVDTLGWKEPPAA